MQRNFISILNFVRLIDKSFLLDKRKLQALLFQGNFKAKTMPFYAVAKGNKTGIFTTWPECKEATAGCKYAKYKKFDSREDAENFIKMFMPHSVESTSKQKLPEIIKDYESDFSDQLLIDHFEVIDQLAQSYKDKLTEEYKNFRSKILSINNVSASNAASLKRKYSTSSENSEPDAKVLKSRFDKNEENSFDFSVDDQGFVHVYTDGACENNGKWNAKAGLGVWFGPNHPLNISEQVKGKATNNVGEIQACTRAINTAYKHGVKKLCINTDSQFVINSMTTWLPGWKKKDWTRGKGEPVKNKEDFKDLDAASKLVTIKWNYVKGHAGIEGNDGADQLAKNGALKYGES